MLLPAATQAGLYQGMIKSAQHLTHHVRLGLSMVFLLEGSVGVSIAHGRGLEVGGEGVTGGHYAVGQTADVWCSLKNDSVSHGHKKRYIDCSVSSQTERKVGSTGAAVDDVKPSWKATGRK